MSLKIVYDKFKQYRWYELITHNSKQTQIFSRTLEIRVQRLMGSPTQVSNYHLI